jgi:hypothetical protein
LILGGLHRDVRGTLQHVNGFSLAQVDRFYAITPALPGEVRGWVGHQLEWKWFFAVRGAFRLGAVQPSNWACPVTGEAVQSFVLDAEAPAVLEVPPAHFTACCALAPGSILLVFSSGRIKGAATDDHRLPPDFWPLPAAPAVVAN